MLLCLYLFFLCRKEDDESKKHKGKMRSKDPLPENRMVEVKLPTVALPLDNLPKIDIAIPPPPVATSVSVSPVRKFVFSAPATVAPVSSLSPVVAPAAAFVFRVPAIDISVSSGSDKQLSRTASDSSEVNGGGLSNKAMRSCEVCKAQMESDDVSCLACLKNAVTNSVASLKSESACSCGNLTTCALCSTKQPTKTFDTNKNNIQPSLLKGFSGFSTVQSGTWECTTCLIRNKQEANECVACYATRPKPKPSVKEDSPITTVNKSPVVTTSAGFGDMFKKAAGSWECEMCLVSNKPDSSSCVACETPKPGLKVTSEPKAEAKVDIKLPVSQSGFGNMFKKASGSWTCDECLVTNNADKVKCAACETVKPGATVPDKSETTAPKFSFGIPTSATNNSSSGTTFSFGINKVDQPETAQKSSLTLPNSTFNPQPPVPSQTFSFGIPKTEKDASSGVSSSSSTKPMFQFGSSATQAIVSDAKSVNITDGKKDSLGNISSNKATPADSRPDVIAKPEKQILSSSVTASDNNPSTTLGTFAFLPKSESTNTEKASTAPVFSFGSNIVNKQNFSSTSIKKKPFAKSEVGYAMFGSKQETNFATSTTNTLSSSPTNNIFKFGGTKTVTSSGNMSISSVSTQPSYSTPKATSVFTFGANPEKKQVSFAITATKENVSTSNVNTPSVENKPVFNSFSATTNSTTAFGNTSTFGSSNFGNKDQPPNPFIPQTTTNLFGASQTTNASGFQTNSFQAVAPQENKSTPVFNFGSAAPKEAAPATGGFVFNPVPEKQPEPRFGFSAAPTNPTGSAFGFNNTANTTSNTFSFEPRPFTPAAAPFGAASNTTGQIFGVPSMPQPVTSFGEQANPNPVFGFGVQPTQAVQAPANPMFEFGSNQVSLNNLIKVIINIGIKSYCMISVNLKCQNLIKFNPEDKAFL